MRHGEFVDVGKKANDVSFDDAGSTLTFAPLGIPTSIIADDPALLAAASANLAGLKSGLVRECPRLVIRLRWNELVAARVGFAISVKGSCLTVEGEGLLGRADGASGTAECSISRAYRADRGALAEIGETLLLFLLASGGRAPVHAAAIMIGETAVLLAGPSGSGKSSLALAAQRHGLEVLSEDTAYVELDPLRVWGWPGAIHLLPSDAPPGDFPIRSRGGHEKKAVPRTLARPCAESAILVAIERGDKLRLEPMPASELVARLTPTEPGFVLFRAPIAKALDDLARKGGWRLTLNANPDEAVALLRDRLERPENMNALAR
jgi:hypothetical protein